MVISLYVLNLHIRQWHQLQLPPPPPVNAWIEAGVNKCFFFSAHSMRSAASSKANDKGLNLTHILKAASRSNAKRFAMFYKKNNSENFGQIILRA